MQPPEVGGNRQNHRYHRPHSQSFGANKQNHRQQKNKDQLYPRYPVDQIGGKQFLFFAFAVMKRIKHPNAVPDLTAGSKIKDGNVHRFHDDKN